MGMVTEGQILTQAKKAQGETNDRLEALIAEQRRTNEMLHHLIGVVQKLSEVPPTMKQ